MIKVVIQCCSSKQEDAGTFRVSDGKEVYFVACPDFYPFKKNKAYRPDDVNPETGHTWREDLINYNRGLDNPHRLKKASELYKPEIYQKLASRYETYILSAGWGLIKSDFLLPTYDITFSRLSTEKWKIRELTDLKYKDFNQLRANHNDIVYFFGGSNYLDLFYKLTRKCPAKKVIYFRSKNIQLCDGYKYIEYKTKIMTNWHYKCAEAFIKKHLG